LDPSLIPLLRSPARNFEALLAVGGAEAIPMGISGLFKNYPILSTFHLGKTSCGVPNNAQILDPSRIPSLRKVFNKLGRSNNSKHLEAIPRRSRIPRN
jgi:hypothetical protein